MLKYIIMPLLKVCTRYSMHKFVKTLEVSKMASVRFFSFPLDVFNLHTSNHTLNCTHQGMHILILRIFYAPLISLKLRASNIGKLRKFCTQKETQMPMITPIYPSQFDDKNYPQIGAK